VTDTHPHDELLLRLALDDVDEAGRESALKHLGTCHRCRNEYDGLSATIEQTLAAAPSAEPSPGFDARVLEAMGLDPAAASHAPGGTPHRSRRWRLAAVSVAAGLVVGLGGGYAASRLDDPAPATLAQNSAALETDDGTPVGTVTRTVLEGEPALLVTVTTGRVGMKYLCLLRLKDGQQIATADWVLDSAQGETWVVRPPDTEVSELVLVANGGAGPVWSTARL
jgi:hypothetical protein